METILAYKNDAATKEKYVARIKAHMAADELVRGTYWENGKGCAVGCTIEMDDKDGELHARYETELGIPEQIAYLEDTLFEGMSNEKAMAFPLRFLESIKVGADLSKVVPRFYVRILMDKEHGTYNVALDDGKLAIKTIADLHQEKVDGKDVPESAVRSAESAARSAARSAESAAVRSAWSAAWSAAWSVWSEAESAARSAARSAWSAAWSAAESEGSAAWSAARSARYDWMGDVLIEILEDTKDLCEGEES